MEFFSPGHLLVIAIVAAILFFGWKQLPDMSRSLGRSLRIFKTEIKGMSQDDKIRESAEEAAPKAIAASGQQAEHAVPARPVARPVPTSPAGARPRPTPRPGVGAGAQNGSRPGNIG